MNQEGCALDATMLSLEEGDFVEVHRNQMASLAFTSKSTTDMVVSGAQLLPANKSIYYEERKDYQQSPALNNVTTTNYARVIPQH